MILKWHNRPAQKPGEWRDWFAWYPVVAQDEYTGLKATIWLEQCQYTYDIINELEDIQYRYKFFSLNY